MDFTVTTKGPTLDTLIRATTRDLKAANRTAGRAVGKVGKAAMAKGAPRMMGRQLTVRAKVDAWPNRCAVEFNPARGQSGAWAIVDTGRRGGYLVKPRRAKALRLPGGFAMTAHPGAVAGHHAWTKATARAAKAINREVHDVYDDALGAD